MMTVITLPRDIDQALEIGDVDRAAVLAGMTTEPRPAEFYDRIAFGFGQQGRLAETELWLRRGLAEWPTDPRLLVSLGMCMLAADRAAEGIAPFTAAATTAPQDPMPRFGLGECYGVDDPSAARDCYRRASELAPRWADPWASLATLSVRLGDAPAARQASESALALAPGHPAALLALAYAELAEKDWRSAEAHVRPLCASPDQRIRAKALNLLGDALHGQGRFADAFAAYESANRAYGPLVASLALHGRRYLDRLSRLRAAIQAATPSPARAADSAPETRRHAFVVGFPRSGTTLLEQVLASHPDVAALGEAPVFSPIEAEFLDVPGGLERLLAMDAASLEEIRAGYWSRVRAAGVADDGRLFVDKMPFNLVHLQLIATLFPDAKIVVAQRDPRDVVLSCWRRNFSGNGFAHLTLTLDGTARVYDSAMQVAEACHEKLSLDRYTVRYESFVAAFDQEARALCAFLDLPWDDAVLDFATHARSRIIRTPSNVQVRQGLYRHGDGQWRGYRAQLAPVLPILDRWIARFGYPAE